MICIQQATSSDTSRILPLLESYWRFEGIIGFDKKRVSAQLERLLSTPNFGAGWIAMLDGKVVGYLLVVYVFSLEYLGLTAEIDELFIHPSQRGKGVGFELLQVAEIELIRQGCTKISLQLSRTNSSAREFYHRLGYAERADYELLDKSIDSTQPTTNHLV